MVETAPVSLARRGSSQLLLALVCTTLCAAQEPGAVSGTVIQADGYALFGVEARLVETGEVTSTDEGGVFWFGSLAPGTYSLDLTYAGYSTTISEVVVAAARATELHEVVDWPLAFADSVTVSTPSRRPIPVAESPAAVVTLSREEIEREASHGQLPKLLGESPGIQTPQSGPYDFNLNSRGFNAFVNRRVRVLVDGRDPSLPVFVGGQEWASVAFPLDELAAVEMVRGPGTALYGAGAFNGVLTLVTKAPRDSQGGRLRATLGELDTGRLEGRWAGRVAENTYLKLLAGVQESETFSVPRVDGVEYEPGRLPNEVIPPPRDKAELGFGSLRLDRYFGRRSLTLEAGASTIDGTLILTGVGRSQRLDVERSFFRAAFDAESWSVSGSYTQRQSEEVTLSAGASNFLDSSNLQLEAEGDSGDRIERGSLLFGAAYARQVVDSKDPAGRQTVFASEQDADQLSVYGQIDYSLSESLQGVLSLRWDDSSVHDSQLSPRAALVWAVTPAHTLRFNYGEAFQSPTLANYFLQVAVGPPLDLSLLEQALAPALGGVPLGFETIPFLAVGNESLEVEKVRSLEVGYGGAVGRVFLSVNLYRAEYEDFVSGLLPQTGTSLGRLNADFGPYAPPADLPPGVAAVVQGALAAALPPFLLPALSNFSTGDPVIAFLSFANFGRVDAQGAEIALLAAPGDWNIELAYSYADFDVKEQPPESPVSPNAPENQLGVSVTYAGDRFNATLQSRWVDSFRWSEGLFDGPVPSYTVVDGSFNYDLRQDLLLTVQAQNLLDDRHWEIFGGDVLERRVLVSLTYSW